ncbi:MAG: DUF177 domain-containing protein [Clostridia bacterium]|nr:DUF177 domain-containing protein [Clostridia bacterium]
MMIIDIRKLNAQKRYSGQMEFEYSAPEHLIEIPYVKFASPVKISFEYDLYEDDSLEIRGTVEYRLEGQCSRCLKDAAVNVVGELDAYFQPIKDYEDYGYTNGVVNLTKAVEDAIMASMPFTLSCGEDCEGIRFSE